VRLLLLPPACSTGLPLLSPLTPALICALLVCLYHYFGPLPTYFLPQTDLPSLFFFFVLRCTTWNSFPPPLFFPFFPPFSQRSMHRKTTSRVIFFLTRYCPWYVFPLPLLISPSHFGCGYGRFFSCRPRQTSLSFSFFPPSPNQ